MEISEVQDIIFQRFIEPSEQKLVAAFGHEGHKQLKLIVNWKTIVDLIESGTEEDLYVAEECIQILQVVALWDGIKKGVLRYISEDKLQLQLFKKVVHNVRLDFLKGTDNDETELLFNKEEKTLIYRINIIAEDVMKEKQQQDIFTSNEFFEALEDTLNKELEKEKEEQEQEEMKKGKVTSQLVEGEEETALEKLQKFKPIKVYENGYFEGFDDEYDESLLESIKGGTPHPKVDDEFCINASNRFRSKSILYTNGSMRRQNHATSPTTPSTPTNFFVSSPTSATPTPNFTSTTTSTTNTTTTTTTTSSNSSTSTGTGGGSIDPFSSISTNPDDDFEDEDVDITPYLETSQNSKQPINDEFQLLIHRPIEDLKMIVRQPRTSTGDLTSVRKIMKLYADKFWKPANDEERKTVILSRQFAKKQSMKLPPPKQPSNPEMTTSSSYVRRVEKHFRTWFITKVNNKGVTQKRILILTTHRLYTVKFDSAQLNNPNNKFAAFDDKHFKYYDLAEYIAVDVNRFKPAAGEKKLQPYGLALYMENPNQQESEHAKRLKSQSSMHLSASEPQPITKSNSFSGVEQSSKETSSNGKKKKHKESVAMKLARKGSKFIKKRTTSIFMGKEEKSKTLPPDIKPRERPNTDILTTQYFMAPDNIHQSDAQQRFLEEVAWCIYAAALALKKSPQFAYEPFTDQLIKRPSVTSFVFSQMFSSISKKDSKSNINASGSS